MNKTLIALACILVGGSATTAFADSVKGKILAFDRKANVIVLNDKTVWSLEGSEAPLPEGLKAGDTVEIETEDGGEDGIGKVEGIKLAN